MADESTIPASVTARTLSPRNHCMAADDPQFICTACGKEYRWKPELAGRKAKCGCGASIVVPAERPSAGLAAKAAAPALAPTSARAAIAAEPNAAPADLKPAAAESSGAKCPACAAALAPNAVLCVNCGYNLKTGKTLSVVVERDEDEPEGGSPAKAAAAEPEKSDRPAP